MLFRTNKGTLIEIKKYDFSNDKLYYQKIMEINKPIHIISTPGWPLPKLEKTLNNKNNK
jgi:hypothetical protein